MKKGKKRLDSTAKCCDNTNMSMIRDTILARMKQLNLTTYRLSKMVQGKVPSRTVYSFISGESDASSQVCSVLMQALGLEIKTKPKARHGRRKGGAT